MAASYEARLYGDCYLFRRVAEQLRSTEPVAARGRAPMVLVPVSSLSRVTRKALAFAEELSRRVVAAHVATDFTSRPPSV